MICPRTDCPVSRTIKSMEDWRASQIAKGVAKSFAVNDYQMACVMCQKPRAWRRDADGNIRSISHA